MFMNAGNGGENRQAFSGADLKYSQISETASGEWFDIRVSHRQQKATI
jgi:hypothetical protein